MGKKDFFSKMEAQGLALTFGDVRLKIGHSDFLPSEADTSTYFSRNIALKIPLVSAAMDTVTEFELAIELAKLGARRHRCDCD